jgi:hypothetical protein
LTACRAEGLGATTFPEWMVDERKAAFTDGASRRLGERIAFVDLDWRADVRAARIDEHVEASIGWLHRPFAC